MTSENKALLTIGLGFFSGLVLIALFISSAIIGEFNIGHLILAAMILVMAVVGTLYFTRLPEATELFEKAKRDSMLDMTDAELLELKHRLARLTNFEPEDLMLLDDDGELTLHQ